MVMIIYSKLQDTVTNSTEPVAKWFRCLGLVLLVYFVGFGLVFFCFLDR